LRKGALRKRTQLKGKVMAKSAWTKRDKTSGEFMVVKKSAKKFQGMRREKALKSDGFGAGHPGGLWITSGPQGASGSTDFDSLNGGSFHKFLSAQVHTSICGRDDPHLFWCERPVNRALGSSHRLGFDSRLARDHDTGNPSGPFPETALDALNDGIFDVPIFHHQPSF
jgi:hypothetical protein